MIIKILISILIFYADCYVLTWLENTNSGFLGEWWVLPTQCLIVVFGIFLIIMAWSI